MLELVHDVWNEKSVLECWSDAILIPIPKKGDLSHCNNWRGIPLLNVTEGCSQNLPREALEVGQG